MPFDLIVSIAEQIQTTNKLTPPEQLPHKQKQFKQWSQGQPMQFTKSDYKLPPNKPATKQRGPPHPEAKHSVNFGHFPNASKDKTKYETFGQQNAVNDQLAKAGKCFLYKKPGHMARDCARSKVRSSYEQVNRKPMYKVTTASSSVESEVDTSQLQVMRHPTDIRIVIIPVSQKIFPAIRIIINGYTADALIDPYTINGDLISANFCFLN